MKLYVGTYAKYNEGDLSGKWMDLGDYGDDEEFAEACRELHKDEEDPEFMCQDYEADHDWEEKLYHESGLPDNTWWEIRDELDRLHVSDDVFDAYVSVSSGDVSVDSVDKCEQAYRGKYNSPEDYAEELCDECGYLSKDIPSIISCHIDWTGVWRDLSYDGYAYENGYVFDLNA